MRAFWGNRYVWAAAAALTALVAAFALPRTEEPANIGVVSRGDLVQRVTIAGNVSPNRKTIISAPYSGYVRRIYVQVGDKVHAGDPVVSLAQSLRGSGEEVYPLRAPFDGTVVQVLRTQGEYVEQAGAQGGGALVRIDDLTRTFVEASAPEIEVGKLKLGQEAVIKASAVLERPYKGVIRHISLAAKEQRDWDRSRVEFPVLIEVADNDGQLRPGMSVVLDVITSKRSGALILRHEFVQKDGEKRFVVLESGERRNIETGLQNEEAFEVKAGLQEGERVRQTDFLSLLKSQ